MKYLILFLFWAKSRMLSADVCLFGHTWLKIDLFYVKSQLKFYEKSNQELTNESIEIGICC